MNNLANNFDALGWQFIFVPVGGSRETWIKTSEMTERAEGELLGRISVVLLASAWALDWGLAWASALALFWGRPRARQNFLLPPSKVFF